MSAVELVGRADERRDALSRPLAGWVNGALVLVALIGIVLLERKRPLRRRIENDPQHDARNLAMSVLSAAAIRVTEKPLMDRLTHVVERKRWGLLKRVHLPPVLEVCAAVVLLDYTLYVWHVLTHLAPFLWRFHRVHHADLDLTRPLRCGSTSRRWCCRFHGEPDRSCSSAPRRVRSQSGRRRR